MAKTLEAPLARLPTPVFASPSLPPENDLNGFPATCSEGKRFAQEAWLRSVRARGLVLSRNKLKVIEAPTNNQQRIGEGTRDGRHIAFYSRQCSRDSLRNFQG